MKLLLGRLRARRDARRATGTTGSGSTSATADDREPCPPETESEDAWCNERRAIERHREGIAAATDALPSGALRAALEAGAREVDGALEALDALARGRPYDDRLAVLMERAVLHLGALHSRLRLIEARDHAPPRGVAVVEDARHRVNALARLVRSHTDEV